MNILGPDGQPAAPQPPLVDHRAVSKSVVDALNTHNLTPDHAIKCLLYTCGRIIDGRISQIGIKTDDVKCADMIVRYAADYATHVRRITAAMEDAAKKQNPITQ